MNRSKQTREIVESSVPSLEIADIEDCKSFFTIISMQLTEMNNQA